LLIGSENPLHLNSSREGALGESTGHGHEAFQRFSGKQLVDSRLAHLSLNDDARTGRRNKDRIVVFQADVAVARARSQVLVNVELRDLLSLAKETDVAHRAAF